MNLAGEDFRYNEFGTDGHCSDEGSKNGLESTLDNRDSLVTNLSSDISPIRRESLIKKAKSNLFVPRLII